MFDRGLVVKGVAFGDLKVIKRVCSRRYFAVFLSLDRISSIVAHAQNQPRKIGKFVGVFQRKAIGFILIRLHRLAVVVLFMLVKFIVKRKF